MISIQAGSTQAAGRQAGSRQAGRQQAGSMQGHEGSKQIHPVGPFFLFRTFAYTTYSDFFYILQSECVSVIGTNSPEHFLKTHGGHGGKTFLR